MRHRKVRLLFNGVGDSQQRCPPPTHALDCIPKRLFPSIFYLEGLLEVCFVTNVEVDGKPGDIEARARRTDSERDHANFVAAGEQVACAGLLGEDEPQAFTRSSSPVLCVHDLDGVNSTSLPELSRRAEGRHAL